MFGSIIIYLLILFNLLDVKNIRALGLLPSLLLLFLSIKIYPELYVWTFKKLGFEEIPYNKTMSARESGYLNYVFYEEAKRNIALKALTQNYNFENRTLNLIPVKDLNNIHLLVLESFYDPNSFENLSFSENPIHTDFQSFNDKQNFSTSPVYGGNTAQAEFEILTGAPALSKYGSIEFNLFSGNKINSALPNLLRELGYSTIATNALKPDIFNSYNAYRSLGFQEQYYITGDTYLKKGNEWFISDSDLLDQNIKFIDSLLSRASSKPIFNYVLGMYGHTPYSIDTSINPLKIDVYRNKEVKAEARLKRSVNQIYYRTRALSNYIKKLNIIDPNAIILITGDHLPSFPGIDDLGYREKDLRKVPFYLIKGTKAVQLNNRSYHHFNLTEIILNFVFKENNVLSINSEERYDEIILQSIQ
ncbi:sulfatase-like hydrolase/transferase [Christiangramia salexigens]|uniref:sulfatase-like hydrolase/transferase n=1 Tax=Christiangramia salexigens TaxID=1913577 RepID=UPI0018DBFF0F|nr:sulfatase-like hydrolase/transferase [Christiangramia salexigens]